MTTTAKWTLLTYIAAHNNLEQFGKKSLLEILNIGNTPDVVQGVLYDGKSGAGRYVMGDPGVVERQEQLGHFDSGDPDEVIATAKWLFEQRPAERYGLVPWSHGSCWDVSFYTANPPAAGDVTKVALDLGRIKELVRATDRLADALRVDMPKVGDLLWQAQYAAQQHETQAGNRGSSKFDYHLWDIGSLAARLTGSDAVSALVKQTAANTVEALALSAGSVLAYGHRGAWFDGTGGVSVYLMPPGQQRISPSYSKLAFANDTQWDEMLEAYHATLG